MLPRSRTRCTSSLRPSGLPERRVSCDAQKRESTEGLFGEGERCYVVGMPAGAEATVDVLDRRGRFVARLILGGDEAVAATLLRDATGHAPRPYTTDAFRREVLDLLPRNGFVLSSKEICAWLLLRALERIESTT